MEILLWLLPAALVMVGAMVWAAWAGREDQGEPDPEVALQRLGEALEKPSPARYAAPPVPGDRSSGVAVRRRAS